MIKESKFTAVLGSGEQGLIWVCQQGDNCFALDKNRSLEISLTPRKFIQGDSLYLPFKDTSVHTIHSDFMLNSIQSGDFIARDIPDNPKILSSDSFPQIVRSWYVDTVEKQSDIKLKIGQVRWLLREAALKEMWRVLTIGGEIIIVDHKHVVEWVDKRSTMILQARNKELMIMNHTLY